MRIAIGSDHAGFKYKEAIKTFLAEKGHEIVDFGTNSEEPVDYPLFIHPTAVAVAEGKTERGIVLGGSGKGGGNVANKGKGGKCAGCRNEETARIGRHKKRRKVISIWGPMNGLETWLTK